MKDQQTTAATVLFWAGHRYAEIKSGITSAYARWTFKSYSLTMRLNMPGIDVTYDFRRDACRKDPDRYSPTLRRYHRHLWSKPLPCRTLFTLSDVEPGAYLYHRSTLGNFSLSSDSIVPTYTRWKKLKHIVSAYPEAENEAFRAIGYTIGGMMIFPANRVDGKNTINVMRGLTRQVADRFDLTLECIRRHYIGSPSPLGETLSRYATFFSLFKDFRGYVDFFLLKDLVSDDYSSVNFFMLFDNFTTPSVPTNNKEYEDYRRCSIEFVHARNRRIAHAGLCDA
ncbi:MAG: hypothetical protein R3D57_13565 [Hyphomicrobiaceae bacterium]